MDTTLVVMAAGMGSRFGGLKQIAPVGPNGEIILDFSVYDAMKAGFSKVVFIIKKQIEADFREAVGKRIEKMADVDYAFQELCDIPEGFSVLPGREKPWGTGQAILSAKSVVKTPFAVINADDYYGRSAFEIIQNHLSKTGEMCLAGYKLGNTLTDNGTVSRGVCEVSEDGFLKSITEHTALDKNSGIPLDTTVSMNMWGLGLNMFDELEGGFVKFFENLKNAENPLKAEFLLPTAIDTMIKEGRANVKVLYTSDRWYGVTYKEDLPAVQAAIKDIMATGMYDGI